MKQPLVQAQPLTTCSIGVGMVIGVGGVGSGHGRGKAGHGDGVSPTIGAQIKRGARGASPSDRTGSHGGSMAAVAQAPRAPTKRTGNGR